MCNVHFSIECTQRRVEKEEEVEEWTRVMEGGFEAAQRTEGGITKHKHECHNSDLAGWRRGGEGLHI